MQNNIGIYRHEMENIEICKKNYIQINRTLQKHIEIYKNRQNDGNVHIYIDKYGNIEKYMEIYRKHRNISKHIDHMEKDRKMLRCRNIQKYVEIMKIYRNVWKHIQNI